MKKYIIIAVIIIAAAFVLMTADNLVETNQDGHYQVKQAWITGDMTVRSQSGTYFQALGTIWDYKNVATVVFGVHDGAEATSAVIPAVPVIFSDGSKGLISGLARVKLPSTEYERMQLKNEFADGYNHFIVRGLVPVINNAIKLSANLRTAQDAYTTLAVFQHAIKDQVTNGTYVTKAVTKIIIRETGDKEEIKATEIVYGDDGQPLREPNRLQELGAVVVELVIDVPQFDAKVEESIAKRKDEAMKTELAKQEALRAKQDAITAEQKGLANVALAKYEKEVEKIKEVTDAQKNFEVAKYAALQAKELAKKIKAEGEANAYANRQLVAAGLTPAQKMSMDIKIADVVSKNIAGASTPSVVFMSSDKGSANEVMKVFGAERALELIKKMSNGK